tara:strand:- start:211 stop:468 length:258 start_codon:yes stop_codon:yes gene_type:complete
MYILLFDKQFKKDIDKIEKKEKDRILKKIFELKEYPELGKHLIGIDLWSLRIGKYRILYRIENNKLQILVLTIGHRKGIYKYLKN